MTSLSSRPAAALTRQRRRQGPVLTAVGVLVALWLGLTAPSVSPVGPPAPAAVLVAPVDLAAPLDAPAVPVVPGDGVRRRGSR